MNMNTHSRYGTSGYAYPYAQQPQQYQSTPPQIRPPFPPPISNPAAPYGGVSQPGNYEASYDAELAQWQSAYAPPDPQDRLKKDANIKNGTVKVSAPPSGPLGTGSSTVSTPDGANPVDASDKRKTVIREGGGQKWEDPSLLEWDPSHFRIMVGNLAGEVTDDSLAKAFAQYGVSKARVIRDKRTTKSKGFGFVSFFDSDEGFKAARQMVGKYIGSHPIVIERSKTKLEPVVKGGNKYKGKHGKNNKNNKGGKGGKPASDPLKASTGAGVHKEPTKPAAKLKLLG